MKFSYLPRMYANIPIIESCVLTLPEDNIHYLNTVLRLKIGDSVRIFNHKDGEFIAQIINITKSNLSVQINNILRTPTQDPEVILGLSIIKNDKMRDAINMAVQLGVTQIVPLIVQHVQSHHINRQKLLKCIIEYTQQSERLVPPTLQEITSLTLLLEKNSTNFVLYANENEDENNTILRFAKTFPTNILVIVGPEGGFTSEELKLFKSTANCHGISLGSTVLRSETAVAACLAQIKLLQSSRHV
ncbi:16S rRNA (uracil(1498)-N(3))-methyltransferase [Candidatus Tisiphia endosymbiont of Nemotelus uliginosus]|uniref:16S rRNA (uracil(1498)-N(3))-methyltransferase n=1 Tax=Candidatus Tisiphia endosymbiont of Nemotelus uliginosus TaxID=3077926 RepID=UPI0035C92264